MRCGETRLGGATEEKRESRRESRRETLALREERFWVWFREIDKERAEWERAASEPASAWLKRQLFGENEIARARDLAADRGRGAGGVGRWVAVRC